MTLISSRRSGHTYKMIGLMLISPNTILICRTLDHANYLIRQYPSLSDRIYSLEQSKTIRPLYRSNYTVLYDNYAVEGINDYLDHCRSEVSKHRSTIRDLKDQLERKLDIIKDKKREKQKLLEFATICLQEMKVLKLSTNKMDLMKEKLKELGG